MALILNSTTIKPNYNLVYNGTPLKQVDVVYNSNRYTVWKYSSLKIEIQIPDNFTAVIVSLNGAETTYSSNGIFKSSFEEGDELIIKTQYGTIHQETLTLSKSYNYLVKPSEEEVPIEVSCEYSSMAIFAWFKQQAVLPSAIKSVEFVSQTNSIGTSGDPIITFNNNQLFVSLMAYGPSEAPASGTANITYRLISTGGTTTATFGGYGSWTKTYNINIKDYKLVEVV